MLIIDGHLDHAWNALQWNRDLLAERNYSDEDIANILHGNWLRLLRTSWTDSQ